MAGAAGGKVLTAMLLVLGLLQNAAATVFTVGQTGSNGGWTFVSSGDQSYDDQFKNTHLVVGDVLSFVFVNGSHNLLEVPAADVSTCDTSSATQTFNSSVDITLTTTGSHGFICGFPGHCANSGMQLLVTVNAAAAPGAAPVPSPVASPKASPGTSPVASPKASPATSPVASPKASPKASPVAAPKSSSSAPPAPPAPAPKGSTPGPTSVSPPPQAPGSSAASVVQTGPAMAMGALLAACAVLAL